MINERKPTIAIDFDGVIHSYEEGWQGPDVIPGFQVEGIDDFLKVLSSRAELVIFSTRARTIDGIDAIQTWLKRYDLDKYITDIVSEKPIAVCYIDDRAIHFDPNHMKDALRQAHHFLDEWVLKEAK